MAVIAFPSWAYNATLLLSRIVQNAAEFTALGSGWSYTPFAPVPPSSVPADSGLANTDTRLQQQLIEARIQTMILAHGFGIADDPTTLRADVLANDSGVTS